MKFYLLLVLLLVNLITFIFNKKINNLINLKSFPDNHRKLHNSPIPAMGWLFFYLNFLVIFIFSFFYNVSDFLIIFTMKEKIIYFFILNAALIYGILDDKFDLNYNQKLLVFIFIFFQLFSIFPIFKLQFI